MRGYEVSAWREFLKKHDDVETYNRMVCLVCKHERPYCCCEYPKFEERKP